MSLVPVSAALRWITRLPIANAIITTENLEQAIARQSDKGRDAARVAVEMANLMDQISDE
jgi:6,7-dimethyl-8-ribityllumazine synthase